MLTELRANARPIRQAEHRTHFLINQNAAAGRTFKRWHRLLPLVRDCWQNNFTYSTTRFGWELKDMVRYILDRHYPTVVAMGGDGTLHYLLNAIFFAEKEALTKMRFGLLNSGTGQGLALSLGLPANLKQQLQIIEGGRTQSIDLGLITYQNLEGRKRHRLFINECQIGLGARVVQSLNHRLKTMGGKWAFGLTAAYCSVRAKAPQIEMVLEGAARLSFNSLGLSIGNGQRTGGGMQLTPLAKLNDGLLDVLVVHQQSLKSRLQNLSRIYTGEHILRSGFSYFQFKTLEIKSKVALPVAADGEFLGFTPCRLTVLPNILNFLV